VKQTNYPPRYIARTAISAGETPLILAACPIVIGRILLSFSRASNERELANGIY